MKSLRLPIHLMLCLLCSGCFILPIPTPERSDSSRQPMTRKSVELLEVGSTNREEVLLNLGAPDIVEGDESVFTYIWSTKAGILFLGFWPGITGTGPISLKDHRLRIEFDENGIVKNYEIEQENQKRDPDFKWN